MTVTVRLDSPERLSTVLAAARRFEPRLEVTATLVDDLYARQNSSTRLAREVVGVFSAVAFVIAIAGVYGVMAFLVAGRRREIGIRMALGAESSRHQPARLRFVAAADPGRRCHRHDRGDGGQPMDPVAALRHLGGGSDHLDGGRAGRVDRLGAGNLAPGESGRAG